MARTASVDPVEKFRFRVTVVSLDLSVDGALTSLAALGSNIFPAGTAADTLVESLAIFTRAGFNKITLPKANIKTIRYRENIDNLKSIKVPGLVTYDNVVLSRGMVQTSDPRLLGGATTANRDMYNWYRLVNEEIALLNVANEFTRDQNLVPTQSNNFRKDVIIEVLNRTGQPVKGYYLFNAFPVSYTPGDNLDASANEKLIEELELTYEAFLELEGGAEGLGREILRGATILGAAAAANQFGGSISNAVSSIF